MKISILITKIKFKVLWQFHFLDFRRLKRIFIQIGHSIFIQMSILFSLIHFFLNLIQSLHKLKLSTKSKKLGNFFANI